MTHHLMKLNLSIKMYAFGKVGSAFITTHHSPTNHSVLIQYGKIECLMLSVCWVVLER